MANIDGAQLGWDGLEMPDGDWNWLRVNVEDAAAHSDSDCHTFPGQVDG